MTQPAASAAPVVTTRSITLTLPDRRQVPFQFPASQLMENVLRNIFFQSEYPVLPFLQNPPASVVVDIGANVGATAVVFGAQYPTAVIYAMEPARQAFDYLARNTAAHFPNVRAFNVGAYDRDADVAIHLGAQASVTNSLVPNALTGPARETVRLRRISSFLAEQRIDHISLLKIDTEGAEIPILNDLQGAGWLAAGTDPVAATGKIEAIFVEYHSEADRLEFDRMLCGGYTLYATRADHPHRGLMCYASKRVLSVRTQWDAIALPHPSVGE